MRKIYEDIELVFIGNAHPVVITNNTPLVFPWTMKGEPQVCYHRISFKM
jgi:hypothetical protein